MKRPDPVLALADMLGQHPNLASCLSESAERVIALPTRGHGQRRNVFESEKCSAQFGDSGAR